MLRVTAFVELTHWHDSYSQSVLRLRDHPVASSDPHFSNPATYPSRLVAMGIRSSFGESFVENTRATSYIVSLRLIASALRSHQG